MALLDVTSDHIMRLDDKALRELIVRLCKADLWQAGLPLSALTAGGHQDARDGGVDVRVALPAEACVSSTSFIPRQSTVFQCKATDLGIQDIVREMKPKGNVRPAIRALAGLRGAYIIASSRNTATDTALQERKNAMHDCIAGTPGAGDLLLDFYDQDRLARWASQFPGVCAWVRDQAGQPIDGWRAHGEWAAQPGGHARYEADTHPRLWTGDADQQAPRPIADGVRALRDRLARERGVARLVGLSGTGKTRLAQALFEEDIDPGSALDPALALYADLADGGRDRLAFLTRLCSDGLRAIVVLDNCPRDQHRRFADLCGGPGSRLSLLTLNLDVQDDQPEGTQVFKLEVASDPVTTRIIQQQPGSASLGAPACRHIAELAGGNARLALALAQSAPTGSLAKLRDLDLFDRLFHQGTSRDETLLRAARACALVYSFNCESDGDTSELAVLAGWAGTDENTLYRHVAELQRRGLAQQRGVWRAVLPQALAIHLARKALEDLSPQALEQSLRQAPPRLMRSFTRQLGLLHDSPAAKDLVRRWLAPANGMPRDIAACDVEKLKWFINIAPVNPEGALAAMERVAMPRCFQFADLRDLCVALAYDEPLFLRATTLLARWQVNAEHQHDTEPFLRLFQVLLSGTQARVSTRLQAVQALLDDKEGRMQQLGLEALGAMLRAGRLFGHPRHSFGARVRDYGWRPPNGQIEDWYTTVLDWMQSRPDGTLRGPLRDLLAAALPRLCSHIGRPRFAQALTSCAARLATGRVWPKAWLAVSGSLRRLEAAAGTVPEGVEGAATEMEARTHLKELEAILAPTGLADQVRVYALSAPWDLNLATATRRSADLVAAKARELDARTCELGRQLAQQQEDLARLLPELIADTRTGRQQALGRGLSSGCVTGSQRKALWARLVDIFSTTTADHRNTDLLCGFIQGVTEQEPTLAHHLLDAAVPHAAVGRHLPSLEIAAAPIGPAGAKRLIQSAKLGIAPAEAFRELQAGDAIRTIGTADLVALLDVLAQRDHGICVAAQLLWRRLGDDRPQAPSDPLLRFGRQILAQISLDCQQPATGHFVVAEVIKACLHSRQQTDPALHALAHSIAVSMRDQFTQYHGNDDMGEIIEALLQVQPTAALDVMFGFDTDPETDPETDAYWTLLVKDNAPPAWLDKVPDDVLLNWVGADPTVRAPRIAAACKFVDRQKEADACPTWTPLAVRLIDQCPGRVPVIEQFVSRFVPTTSWEGSRAAIVEQRRALLKDFCSNPDPTVAGWARSRDAALSAEIEEVREEERHWELQRQGFED